MSLKKLLPLLIILLSILVYALIPYLKERADKVVSQELLSLLDPDDLSAREFKKAQATFKALDLTMVIFEHKDPKILTQFMNHFEKELDKAPLPHTNRVIKDIKQINSFFDIHSPLYISHDVYEYLMGQLSKDKWLNGGKKDDYNRTLKEQKLKTATELRRSFKSMFYKFRHAKLSKVKSLQEGKLVSEDGQTGLFILIHPVELLSNLNQIKEFSLDINKKIADAKASVNTGVNVIVSGDTSNYYREYQGIWDGFGESIIISLTLTLGVLYFLFRNFRSIVFILHALMAGMILAAFFILSSIDEINSNSIFLLVVVMGNAVNSNIVIMHYFLYSNQEDRWKRVLETIKKSFWPTSFAVSISCLVYLSFYASEFRGYQDMGLVGLIGMSTSWVTGGIVLFGLFLSPLGNFSSKETKAYMRDRTNPWGLIFSHVINQHKSICAATAVLMISAVGLLFTSYNLEEKDMTQLKDENYLQYNSDSISRYLDKVGLSSSILPQMVLVTENRRTAMSLQGKIGADKMLRAQVPTLKTFTINDLLPPNQEKTVEVIKQMRKSYKLEDILESHMISSWQEKLASDAYAFDTNTRVLEENIPEELRSLFIDQDGNYGNVIYLSFNLSKLERNIDHIKFVVNRIKELGDGNLYMAGTIPLLSAIEEISTRDRPFIIWSSLLMALVLIIIFNLRTRKYLGSYLFSYFAIASIFFIYLYFSGTKINILNFIALPMTIALGIDYISNYAQGFDLNQNHSSSREKTFTMVATMSFTTLVSYLSIYFTTPQLALKSFAKVAFVGEVITLFGGMIFFFAFLTLQEKFLKKKKTSDTSDQHP